MSLLDALKRANLNGLADHLRSLGLQNLLGGIPIHRRKFNFDAAGASSSHVATLDHMSLVPELKALSIVRATVRAGGVTGELTAQAYGTTPATTQIAVAPNGDIVALGTDAITDVDVSYIPIPCKKVTLTDFPVDPATGVLTLPSWVTANGVVYLHSAVVTAGGVTGQKRVLVPGATNPATPQCRLSVPKTAINFTAADAVTKATVVLAVQPDEDVYALLNGNEKTV